MLIAYIFRSMRLLATKMGMSLSEHGLRAGVIRQVRILLWFNSGF